MWHKEHLLKMKFDLLLDFPVFHFTGAGEASYSTGTRHVNREDCEVGGGQSFRSGKRNKAPSRRKLFPKVKLFIHLWSLDVKSVRFFYLCALFDNVAKPFEKKIKKGEVRLD